MTATTDFAILAPVPLEHLESGEAVARQEGFVAFGTNAWELLREVDGERGGLPVAVLLYPSHDRDGAPLVPAVSWFGWYIGSVDSRNGAHPLGMQHRPPTTAKYPDDNIGHWAAFWHVRALQRLPDGHHMAVADLRSFRSRKYLKGAVPRGPSLVEFPPSLARVVRAD